MKGNMLILTMIGFFSFSSCLNFNKMLIESEEQNLAYKESFKGKTSHELVQLEGPPSYKKSDENGGEIFVYQRTYTARKYVNNMLTDYLAEETKMFFLNKTDKIYNIITKSEPIPENNQIIINTK